MALNPTGRPFLWHQFISADDTATIAEIEAAKTALPHASVHQ